MKRLYCLIVVLISLLVAICGCTQSGVTSYGQNLFVNSTFDEVNSYEMPQQWQYVSYDVNPAVIDAYARDGAAHLTNYSANDSRFIQTVSVEKNVTYRISALITACDIIGEQYGAGISIQDTFIASNQVFDTGGQWELVELYVNSGTQTQLGVELRLGFFSNDVTGKAAFKDVNICAVEQVPAGVDVYTYQAYKQPDKTSSVEQTEKDRLPVLMLLAFSILLFIPLSSALFRRDANMEKQRNGFYLYLIGFGIAALLIRLIFAVIVPGYQIDINCFVAWSHGVYQYGPSSFYQSISFCDYPPGYLYVLWMIEWFRNLVGIELSSTLHVLLLKLPAMLCDVAAGFILARYLRIRIGDCAALVTVLFYWLNPAVLINSACWGQIDGVLVLGLTLMMIFLCEKKLLYASICFALSVLFKPQALMTGPLLLFGFIDAIITDRKRGWQALLQDFIVCAALCMVVVLPFWGTQSPTWIFEKYLSTISSYQYASVNAMNLFTLLGGNWVDQKTALFGLITYQQLGTGTMLLVMVYAAFVYFRRRDSRSLPLCAAYILCGIFVLGVRMHERYLFPALMLLLIAWGAYRDIRLLYAFVAFSATQFMNVSQVLFFQHLYPEQSASTTIFSCINLLALGYFSYILWDICICGRCVLSPKRPLDDRKARHEQFLKFTQTDPERARINRFDVLAICIVTVVYGAFSLWNLGDAHAPITSYTSTGQDEVIEFCFDEPFELNQFVHYRGISNGTFTLSANVIDDGVIPISFNENGNVQNDGKVPYEINTMFMWLEHKTEPCVVDKVWLTFNDPGVVLIEVGFKDENGYIQSPYQVSNRGARDDRYDPNLLVDEQDQIPDHRCYMNSMYFDEIYHARTAFEHLNGMQWYETTHPPLGKTFMSLCILVFGMNPFGWRLAGALAGCFMLPGIYLFVKLLFKKSKLALLAMLLMAFDCMHYTQTRIATIDSFVVLFIIWMFYFMMRYVLLHDFSQEKLIRTFPSLLLSGMMMGFGVASKWTGAYAGVGLAIVFFYAMIIRFRRCAILAQDDHTVLMQYWKNAVWTCLWCVLAFVLIPIVIYLLSYTQFFMIKGGKTIKDLWDAQLYMFNYHAGLKDSHPFASPWYEWPLIIRPMWYYKGNYNGMISSINAMGNPAVWWSGFLAILCLLVKKCSGKAKDISSTLILVGFAAQFLPWLLVPRSTFIYHYFTSVPFIIFAMCYLLNDSYDRADFKGRRRITLLSAVFLAIVILLFAFFFPAISGLDMTEDYAKLLKWLPTWTIWSK